MAKVNIEKLATGIDKLLAKSIELSTSYTDKKMLSLEEKIKHLEKQVKELNSFRDNVIKVFKESIDE